MQRFLHGRNLHGATIWTGKPNLRGRNLDLQLSRPHGLLLLGYRKEKNLESLL